MQQILIVDDDDNLRESLVYRFRKEGYIIKEASNGTQGLELLRSETFDLVITDLVMEGVGGLQVIKEAKEIDPNIEIVLITAYGTIETAVDAIKSGAYDYISKESDIEAILLVVNRALEKKQLVNRILSFEKELKEKFKFDEIIGSSPVMLEVLKTITKVSATDTTILITGPSGTGKELIGKAVHYNSGRSSNPLVILNCGTIPENLQESELFGHKKGAFTGADYDKKGLIEEANGGTLILDEVGELSLSTQVKLLRLLQNKEIRRVGENQVKTVNIRIIAMTNRNLKEEINLKTFREDLYFRLNVIPIIIPPLRERKTDITILIDHFIGNLREKLHKPNLKISRRAVNLLSNYSWPGNVRELENVIERCAILCENDNITPEDLPSEIYSESGNAEKSLVNTNLTLEELEKHHILAVWKESSGNKTEVADKLGISRGKLIYKLKQYGIE